MNFINTIANGIERAVGGFVAIMAVLIVVSAFISQADFEASQENEATRLKGTKLKASLGDPTMDRAYRTLKRHGVLEGARTSLTDMDRVRLNSYYSQLRSRRSAESSYSGFDESSDRFSEAGSGGWDNGY